MNCGRNLQPDTAPDKKGEGEISVAVEKVEKTVDEDVIVRNCSPGSTPACDEERVVEKKEEGEVQQPPEADSEAADGEETESKDEINAKGRGEKRNKKRIAKPSNFDVLFGKSTRVARYVARPSVVIIPLEPATFAYIVHS